MKTWIKTPAMSDPYISKPNTFHSVYVFWISTKRISLCWRKTLIISFHRCMLYRQLHPFLLLPRLFVCNGVANKTFWDRTTIVTKLKNGKVMKDGVTAGFAIFYFKWSICSLCRKCLQLASGVILLSQQSVRVNSSTSRYLSLSVSPLWIAQRMHKHNKSRKLIENPADIFSDRKQCGLFTLAPLHKWDPCCFPCRSLDGCRASAMSGSVTYNWLWAIIPDMYSTGD